MIMRKFEKCVLLLIIALIALVAAGCAAPAISEQSVSNDALTNKVSELEGKIAELKQQADKNIVIGINALLSKDGDSKDNAQNQIEFLKTATINAYPVISDGMAFDYWNVNGKRIDEQNQQLTINVSANTAIEAVLKELPKISAVNAFFQLLDDKKEPTGDKISEYVINKDNNETEDGKISIYLCAQIPKGFEIDYWLINNKPHHFNKAVTEFKALDLSDSVEYEAVLKKSEPVKSKSKKSKTAPKTAPNAICA